jgi:hypothetical protein
MSQKFYEDAILSRTMREAQVDRSLRCLTCEVETETKATKVQNVITTRSFFIIAIIAVIA